MSAAVSSLPGVGGSEDARPSPLVSVVIPVHNGESYLVESLESVLAQTYPSVEIVVVDDASYDGTPEILHPYTTSGRIRMLRNASNLGQFASVNVGIIAANGQFIAIQHADDVYCPLLLAREVELLQENPAIGAAFSFDIFIDANGAVWGKVEPPPEFRGDVVLKYHQVLDGILRYGNVFIRGGTSVVRREVYESVGPFDESFGLRGDLDMWLRIARTYPIGIVDAYLTRYRWGHDHESSRYEHLRREPELSFAVIDRELALATTSVSRDAVRAYEARRAEDLLVVAANLYVLDMATAARSTLSRIKVRRLIVARRSSAVRQLVVLSALRVLARLPRSRLVAAVLYRRLYRGR